VRFVDTSNLRTRFDERVSMQDGTELSCDLYLPSEPGSFPVLIERTPYDNNRTPQAQGSGGSLGGRRGDFPPREPPAELYKLLAAHGYLVIACDVRGRGDSDGAFEPFRHEATDGAATIAWALALPESNGRAAMFGTGYAGFCAWAAASERPDGLVTLASSGPFGAPFLGLPSRGGAWRLDWLFWMHLVGGRLLQPPDLPVWRDAWTSLPIRDLDDAIGHAGLPWKSWLEHPSRDDFWAPLELAGKLAGLEIPALHLGGWWDEQMTATRYYWDAMQRSPAAARQRLLVGPWDHAGLSRPQPGLGGYYFGPRSAVDVHEVLLEWFDEQLRSVAAPPRQQVRVFTTGLNEWQELPAWPPQVDELTLWLSSTGRANTSLGDGELRTTAPGSAEVADSYTYDPQLPVPLQPGFASFSRDEPALVTLDQTFAEYRDDCLCYTSGPLTEPLAVLGVPRLLLWSATDGPGTDWVAAVSDVFPTGGSLHLCHAIRRQDIEEGPGPGRFGCHELEFGDIAHEFQAGHRIRLLVTSSLFPLYARNLNTDEPFSTATAIRRAEQRVGHGVTEPSRLLLPVHWAGPPGSRLP
jgi:putative CocE/NonD family hydrolase